MADAAPTERPKPRRRWRHLRPRLALAVLLALAGLTWPAPSTVSAGEPYRFVWPSITPAQAAPGTSIHLDISVQAQGADGVAVLTLVVAAVTSDAAPREVIRQPNQRFGGWQIRRYQVDWTVPADQPAGDLTLLFLLLDPDGAEQARWQAVLPVLPGDGAAPPTVAPAGGPAPAAPDRPPRRCATEFQIVGADSFVQQIRDHLASIYRISPDDYDMIMTCQEAADATRIVRIVQAGPPFSRQSGAYSDASNTIWLRNEAGLAAASLLVHEAAHINRTGWNLRGSPDCTPENNALEYEARFLDRAVQATADTAERVNLIWLAGWYRAQKGAHNCPAR